MKDRTKEAPVATAVPAVKVTVERTPFCQPNHSIQLHHAGTARANIAATYECPDGTLQDDWATRHQDATVLQQHCEYFDSDRDGVIWPHDTFWGFHRLGFGVLLSLVAVFIIHANFAYPTSPSWIPDPLFRVHLSNVHKDKHGSDTGSYDTEGRFVSQKFEDIFFKYAEGRDYLTLWDISKLLKGQRLIMDPIGWFAAFFEWIATYLMLWPHDGRMMKEDIRRIYDGSIFYTIARRREGGGESSRH